MTTPCKVSISALVVVGVKEILNSGRMYDDSVDVKAIIKMAMDKAAAQAERSMCFVKAEAYASAAAAAQESGSGSGDGGGSRSGGASGGGGGGGSRSGGREKRKEPPPPENFSSTSGAAKRRAAKAAKEAAANAPGLRELIEAALAGVAKRGLGVVSRSMLRANVKTIDLAKRDFKDKDEWKKVLKVLQEAGKLTYDAVNDSISLPA